MPRPDGRLDPGEPLRVSARAWNRAQDAADIVLGLNSGVKGFPNQSSPAPFVWVLGKNTTSGTIDRFACLSIAGLEVTPVEDEDDKSTIDFLRGPVLSCGSPTAGGTVVVAIDPIKTGKIGRVAVAGAIQVRASDLSHLGAAQVLWSDEHWGLVVLGGSGGVRLGTISATWSKGSSATVTRQKRDGTALTPAQTFTARNWFATITVSSGTKRVACANVDGWWILIAAEC
jgi:hypothetical protein